jgi:hypothetical protein
VEVRGDAGPDLEHPGPEGLVEHESLLGGLCDESDTLGPAPAPGVAARDLDPRDHEAGDALALGRPLESRSMGCI